jgi:hypothetical protein
VHVGFAGEDPGYACLGGMLDCLVGFVDICEQEHVAHIARQIECAKARGRELR